LGIVVAAVAFVFVVVMEIRMRRAVVPPAGVDTFAEFLGWHPEPWGFAMLEVSGVKYLLAYGDSKSVLMMNSGTSAYVFDESGKMVDWTSDSGDDGRFRDKWNRDRYRGGVTRAEAEGWVKEK
jgi:hypothetical protein